jgi:hypothetical protein
MSRNVQPLTWQEKADMMAVLGRIESADKRVQMAHEEKVVPEAAPVKKSAALMEAAAQTPVIHTIAAELPVDVPPAFFDYFDVQAK